MESITIGARIVTPPRPSTSGSSGAGLIRPRPSMEGDRITVGARFVPASGTAPMMVGLPSRPNTSGNGSGRRAVPSERFYSESIYPDQEDFEGEDRGVSKYGYGYGYGGERRFGVVTPSGTTPTRRGWEENGRPF